MPQAYEGTHRKQMPEQLLVHVGLSKERHHQHLLLLHAQPRVAIDITVQV